MVTQVRVTLVYSGLPAFTVGCVGLVGKLRYGDMSASVIQRLIPLIVTRVLTVMYKLLNPRRDLDAVIPAVTADSTMINSIVLASFIVIKFLSKVIARIDKRAYYTPPEL